MLRFQFPDCEMTFGEGLGELYGSRDDRIQDLMLNGWRTVGSSRSCDRRRGAELVAGQAHMGTPQRLPAAELGR